MSRVARIGVDVGGTFTDIVLALPDGRIYVNKTTTTPVDPGEGVAVGVAAVLVEARLDPREVETANSNFGLASRTGASAMWGRAPSLLELFIQVGLQAGF